MSIRFDPDDYQETDDLLRAAVDCGLATDDFAAGLARFGQVLPEVAPTLLRQAPADEVSRRSLAFAIFNEVWKALPRPDRGWRPLPAPRPERNSPCPCGSGRKFKQCCGQSGLSPFAGSLSVLGYVLERLPDGEFARLPFKLLSPDELAHVASQWMEEDRHDQAVALLEPLLADPARLDERHEYAFDVLCDAYLDLGRNREKRALVESMLTAPDRELRSAAMHRRCTMLADEGNYDAAWRLFKDAQRADPDNPSLAHLELVMLADQGQADQIATRARFWAARLRRLGYEDEPIVNLMDDAARDPQGFIRVMEEHGGDPFHPERLGRLAELAEQLPAPACHYRLEFRLESQDGSAGPLEPDAELDAIERQWQQQSGFGEGHPWTDTGWVDWLAAHPLAWQSFAVLEDVLIAVDAFEFEDEEEGGMLDDIEDALLDHAVELLRRVIADNRADGQRLEWGWLQNRAALGLLARKIEVEEGTGDELPLLEWMVLTLNPNDNHGLREHLVHAYAAAGRPLDALAVYDRYADDAMGAMLYGRVLALVLLGRRADATVALANARKLSPRILKTLTAARPKPPKDMQHGIITVGGEDEAWRYRMRWHGVWEGTGAMAWLKQAAGVKG
jgi:tetratricopeptide (TPR) repeat protein